MNDQPNSNPNAIPKMELIVKSFTDELNRLKEVQSNFVCIVNKFEMEQPKPTADLKSKEPQGIIEILESLIIQLRDERDKIENTLNRLIRITG
jgi:hypothetical protein